MMSKKLIAGWVAFSFLFLMSLFAHIGYLYEPPFATDVPFHLNPEGTCYHFSKTDSIPQDSEVSEETMQVFKSYYVGRSWSYHRKEIKGAIRRAEQRRAKLMKYYEEHGTEVQGDPFQVHLDSITQHIERAASISSSYLTEKISPKNVAKRMILSSTPLGPLYELYKVADWSNTMMDVRDELVAAEEEALLGMQEVLESKPEGSISKSSETLKRLDLEGVAVANALTYFKYVANFADREIERKKAKTALDYLRQGKYDQYITKEYYSVPFRQSWAELDKIRMLEETKRKIVAIQKRAPFLRHELENLAQRLDAQFEEYYFCGFDKPVVKQENFLDVEKKYIYLSSLLDITTGFNEGAYSKNKEIYVDVHARAKGFQDFTKEFPMAEKFESYFAKQTEEMKASITAIESWPISSPRLLRRLLFGGVKYLKLIISIGGGWIVALIDLTFLSAFAVLIQETRGRSGSWAWVIFLICVAILFFLALGLTD